MKKALRAILPALNKIAVLALVMALLAGLSLNSYIYDNDIQVNINVDGIMVKTFNTEATTVRNILEDENMEIAKGDVVWPSADTKLFSDTTITVKKLKSITIQNRIGDYDVKTAALTADELEKSGVAGLMPTDSILSPDGFIEDGEKYPVLNAYLINVYADGCTYPVYMSKGKVSDAVALAGLSLDNDDFTTPALTDTLYDGIDIYVTRVSTVYTSYSEQINFETERIVNRYLKPKEAVVTVEGVIGEKVVDKIITYHNGKAVSENVTEMILREPVNKVIEYGVWNVKKDTEFNGEPAIGTVAGHPYSKVLDFKATAYCDKGLTASSITSQVGVVAVDPRVIPLGTRLYIEASDGSWSYGVCLAGDTGGAIKGNKVDLFYDSYYDCIQFGRRSCKVYILAD